MHNKNLKLFRIYIVSLTLIFINSSLLAQDNPDVTSLFVNIYKNINKYESLKELNNYEVFFVRGYLTGMWDKIPGTNFMVETVNWMKKKNIDLTLVDVNPTGTVEENANIIIETLKKRNSSKKVILVGHSKGGVDILHALLKMPLSEVKMNVAGVLGLQVPYHGSPLADWVISHKSLSWLTDYILKKWGKSNINSLQNISLEERQNYNEVYASQISELVSEAGIPFISMATWMKNSFPDKTLLFPRRWILGDSQNDGMVTKESSKLKGGLFIELEGLDHAAPVMKGIREVDRELLMKALLTLTLLKIENHPVEKLSAKLSLAEGGNDCNIPFLYPLYNSLKGAAHLISLATFLSLLPRGMAL